MNVCPNCGYEHVTRNNDQNALFHFWMQVLCDEIGIYSLDEMKLIVKRAILGMKEKVDPLTGEVFYEDYQTSRMTVKQMAYFTNKVKIWAQVELNTYLPNKEDKEAYNQMVKYYLR